MVGDEILVALTDRRFGFQLLDHTGSQARAREFSVIDLPSVATLGSAARTELGFPPGP
jgi:hypothetical protein